MLGPTEGFLGQPGATPRAVRLCLGPPATRLRLQQALETLRDPRGVSTRKRRTGLIPARGVDERHGSPAPAHRGSVTPFVRHDLLGLLLMRALLFSLLVLAPVQAQASDPVHRLSLGDSARRDKDVTLVLDAAVDTATGETLGPDELAARLDKTRLLLLGESHTSVESHRVQLHVLRALARRGRAIRVGLEMFPYTEQTSLDSWNAGRWSEAEFVDKARWSEHWGYHWGYYRDVLLFARAQNIPIFARERAARPGRRRSQDRHREPVCRAGRAHAPEGRHRQRRPPRASSKRRLAAAMDSTTA